VETKRRKKRRKKMGRRSERADQKKLAVATCDACVVFSRVCAQTKKQVDSERGEGQGRVSSEER
jgi:hypothetical protein